MNSSSIYLAGIVDSAPLPKVTADDSTLQTILTIGFGMIGALAVLFIVIGGLRYITAGGDQARTASARSQIAYALVGLVVAGMAEVIVNYVLEF